MLRIAIIALLSGLLLSASGTAQEQPRPGEQKGPPVRLNIMNVCTPPAADKQEIAAALNRISMRPPLAADFEIARGRSTLDNALVARWVRVRHDFAAESPYSSVQYSFSDDAHSLSETLVLRLRELKDEVQVAIEDSVSGGNTPAAVLATNTPPNRVKVERFGKASVGLVRCPNADQSAYEPLFQKAAEIMTSYRAALRVRAVVPAELARLAAPRAARPAKARK